MFEQEMGEKREATEIRSKKLLGNTGQGESCQPAVSPQRKMSEALVKHVRECRANERTARWLSSPCAQRDLETTNSTFRFRGGRTKPGPTQSHLCMNKRATLKEDVGAIHMQLPPQPHLSLSGPENPVRPCCVVNAIR
jgi:hypothetical protein